MSGTFHQSLYPRLTYPSQPPPFSLTLWSESLALLFFLLHLYFLSKKYRYIPRLLLLIPPVSLLAAHFSPTTFLPLPPSPSILPISIQHHAPDARIESPLQRRR